jgi:hypothetical protein
VYHYIKKIEASFMVQGRSLPARSLVHWGYILFWTTLEVGTNSTRALATSRLKLPTCWRRRRSNDQHRPRWTVAVRSLWMVHLRSISCVPLLPNYYIWLVFRSFKIVNTQVKSSCQSQLINIQISVKIMEKYSCFHLLDYKNQKYLNKESHVINLINKYSIRSRTVYRKTVYRQKKCLRSLC